MVEGFVKGVFIKERVIIRERVVISGVLIEMCS